jgi:hypothetical protein
MPIPRLHDGFQARSVRRTMGWDDQTKLVSEHHLRG